LYNANALSFAITGGSIKNQNSIPGKLMGLAAYGEYDPELENWLRNHQFFADYWQDTRPFFSRLQKDWGIELNHFDTTNPFIQNIVATFQAVFERETLAVLERLQRATKADYLYFTGGAALNIKLNTKIHQSNLFQEVYIPPCTNDTGLAIGAGAYHEYYQHGTIEKALPYLNNWESDVPQTIEYEEEIKDIAEFLLQRKVLGVINGWGEVGPRALGNRSIISLPDSEDLAQYISMTYKQREWYRPIAPVMLEKNARLVTGQTRLPQTSHYMLLDFKILQEYKRELAGVLHVDGTSRIQVISRRNENPFLFDLLDCLDSDYQIKALINTSFNRKGEPMVQTADQAFHSARQMNLDGVVWNGKLFKMA
jgi:carbamoyltransferase